jgi:hypothetical protein
MREKAWIRSGSILVLAVCCSLDCGGATEKAAGSGGAAGSESSSSSTTTSGSLASSTSSTSSSSGGSGSVSYTLRFIPGSPYLLYASLAGGAAHSIQLDTGSDGLYVPRAAVGSAATISTTATCSITYVSSGNTLAGHLATGPITLLGSTPAGDLATPPTTVPMSFCAVDDATFTGGVMGVGWGRPQGGLAQNVMLQMADIAAHTMHAGYVLSTHPEPNVQIGITATRSAGFQTVQLQPSTTQAGDWLATSLKGCVALPKTPGFAAQCGSLLVDTGIAETILWGLADPTLGGIVPSGQKAAPAGTSFAITTEGSSSLDFSFVLGSGADTPSAVDVRGATAFSINTGRALLVDYDYLFDSELGLVGFEPM